MKRLLLISIMLHLLSGCVGGSGVNTREVPQPSEIARQIVAECRQDFAEHFSANEPIVVDGYYSYGRVYDITISKTAKKGFLPGNRYPLKDKVRIALSLGNVWSVSSENYNPSTVVADSEIESVIERRLGYMVEWMQKDGYRLSDYICENKKAYPLFLRLSREWIGKQVGTLELDVKRDKYLSPEQLEEREKEKKMGEAFVFALYAGGVEMFVQENPFRYANAETLFKEWALHLGIDGEAFASEFQKKMQTLNNDEQHELKRKMSQYTGTISPR